MTLRPARRAPDEVDLGEYAQHVRRNLTLLVLCGLLGTMAGLVSVALTPPTYTSTRSVLVTDAQVILPSADSVGPKIYSLDTEAQRVVSDPVLRAVRTATGDGDPAGHIAVTAIPVTRVLLITYTADSRSTAAAGAKAAAAAYVRARETALEQRRQRRIAALDIAIGRLQSDLHRLLFGQDLADPSATQARRALTAAAISARQTERREVALSTVQTGGVIHVSQHGPTRPNPTVPPLSGLVVGVLIGALASQARPRPLTSHRDVHNLLRGLAVVERYDADGEAHIDHLVRRVMGAPGGGPRFILVCPVHEMARPSSRTVATEIAAALTLADPNSALVTFREGRDLRATRVPHTARLGTRTYVHLDLPLVPDRADLVTDWLDSRNATVVFDGPPATSAEAALLASLCDDTILVAVRGQDERELRVSLARVARSGGNVEGIVLVDSPRRPQAAVVTGAGAP